jgi:hypothetical protein
MKYSVTGTSHKSWAYHPHTVQRYVAIRVDISGRQHRIQGYDTCNHITPQCTHCMGQAPSSLVDRRTSDQEITNIFYEILKFITLLTTYHYRTPSQLNWAHNIKPQIYIHFSIILTFALRFCLPPSEFNVRPNFQWLVTKFICRHIYICPEYVLVRILIWAGMAQSVGLTSRIRFPVEERILLFATIATGSVLSRWQSGRSENLAIQLHLVPRLRIKNA